MDKEGKTRGLHAGGLDIIFRSAACKAFTASHRRASGRECIPASISLAVTSQNCLNASP